MQRSNRFRRRTVLSAIPRALSVAMLSLVVVRTLGAAPEPKPVQVYLLAGQSNMDGYGGLEALRYQATQGERKDVFQKLVTPDGTWTVRDDVSIVFGERQGPLSAGFGVGKEFFGVEWEFGNVAGDHHDAKVLLIKASWGGASIRREFRPPSSGAADELVEKEYARRLADHQKAIASGKESTKPELAAIRDIYGRNYRKMLGVVRETLAEIATVVPGYAGEGYEIAGFVWFQGFNDQFDGADKEYAIHLANLIRDVRKELGRPTLPVVIGQMGHGGTVAAREERGLKPIGEPTQNIKTAQAAVAAMDEFRGTVAVVPTDVFWDWMAQDVFDKGWKEHIEEWKRIGAHYPYHYLGSPYTFAKAGRAFGDAMVELHAAAK